MSLVQAYLQLNGYFTSAEYPIMESAGRGYRTVTDIDVLAFRFPTANGRAHHEPLDSKERLAPSLHDLTDPGLGVPDVEIDMIIGEVKEGRVGINTGARDPNVLRNVLQRFGTFGDEPEELVDGLLRVGHVRTARGYQVRLVAFGAFPPGSEVPPCRIISLGHVLDYLQRYVRQNWNMLRHCQFKDPAFGFLMTLEKARRGGAGRRGTAGVEVVPPAGVVREGGRRGRGKGAPAKRRR